MIHVVPKKGVPALAYPDGASEPQQYTLKILCSISNSIPQFVVSLEKSIPVEDSKHLITLRYEGPNIVPGQCALRDDKTPAPPELLNDLARGGTSQIQALSLKLKEPCSVWYPKSLSNRKSSLTGSNELLTLAKATKVFIVFDTKWVHQISRPQLMSIIRGSTPLTGISVNSEFVDSYQRSDWSIFDPAQDAKPGTYLLNEDLTSGVIRSIEDVGAGTPPTEGEDDVAPPSYTHVTGKRLRDLHPSLKPDTPSPKRVFQDTSHAFSPERAASTSSTDTVPVDLFQEAVEAAVKKLIDTKYVEAAVEKHIDTIVAKYVEAAVAKMLSDALHKELASEPLVKRAVSDSVKAHLGNTLDAKVEDALEQISEGLKSAEVKLEEMRDEIWHELETNTEDQLAAFNDSCNARIEEKSDEFKEFLEESQKGVEEHADAVVREVYDRIDTAATSTYDHGVKVKQSKPEQTRRTMSLPP